MNSTHAHAGGHAHHHAHHHSASAESGSGIFSDLFRVYVPRRECMFHEPDVIWTHIVSDIFITSAYFSIPIALVYFYRKRGDLAFNWVFILFATFIFACGATHLFQLIAIWHPLYRLEGFVKVITAIASVGTATVLWPLIPKALALPSPAVLRAANIALEEEIRDRREAQAQLRRAHDELEDRVRERTAELERLSRMKDDFLATLSHELRTPLNAILGWVHLIQEGRLDEKSFEEGLAVIDRNARTQTRLVSDLLDMSRIISGKMHLDVRTIDLLDVVNAAIETVRPAADAQQITIETHFGDDLRPVWGDPDRLQQLVWNLLSNAVKFTPRDGLIRVEVQRVDSRMEIRVIDTGTGIAPEILPYVFEKFRQAEEGITRRYGGLGLGLAIVRHIAELHGGQVEARSEGLGRGSTFIARLPILPVRGGVAGAPESEEVPDDVALRPEGIELAGGRILVVDDDEDSASLVKQLLITYGASVAVAHSVSEAMDFFDDFDPQLIISDIGMPEQDGYDLMRQVRQRSNVPAIALTAFARPADAQRALDAGYQKHLSKPAEPAKLLALAEDLLRQYRS